jgi:hypothetical protein
MAPTPLSPFIGELASGVRDALVALLGLDPARVEAFDLTATRDAPARWNALLTVALPSRSLVLDVSDPSLSPQAWFRTPHLAWSYRAVSTDADPFADPVAARWLQALRERATRVDGSPLATPAVRRVRDAVARYLPFAGHGDASYRLLMEGPDGPPTGILWLGFQCDQDCVVCWQRRVSTAPPPELFLRWLDEMLAAGAKGIILSGGEPTLHPALPDLARRARAGGANVILETNAIRLADDAFRRSLVAAGVGELFASLHAPDAATSEAITRAPGTHAQTVAGVEAWLRDGLPAGIHCVVERSNAAALAAHAAFVVERLAQPHRDAAGASLLRRVVYSLPTRYADEERYRRGLAPLELVRPGLSAALRVLRGAGVEARILGMGGFPLCAVEDALAEQPRQEVSAAERGDRVYGLACGGCAARPGCGGLPTAYFEACGEGGLRPVQAAPMTGRGAPAAPGRSH